MWNVKGRIKVIEEVQTFDSGFTKQRIVITTDEKYPQDIAIDFTKDNIAKLNGFTTGKTVDVSINIRGNEYNNKYYVNLEGWKIEGIANEAVKAASDKMVKADLVEEPTDDLPF